MLILSSCSDARLKVASGTNKSDVKTININEELNASNAIVASEPNTSVEVLEQSKSKKAISESEALREMHACYLAESPFTQTLN